MFRSISASEFSRDVWRLALGAESCGNVRAQCNPQLLPEFRTRFHRKTFVGVMKLGRVGVLAGPNEPCRLDGSQAPIQGQPSTKRAFITRPMHRVKPLEGFRAVVRFQIRTDQSPRGLCFPFLGRELASINLAENRFQSFNRCAKVILHYRMRIGAD